MAGQAALQKRETLANNSAPKEYFDVSIVTRLDVYQCRKQTTTCTSQQMKMTVPLSMLFQDPHLSVSIDEFSAKFLQMLCRVASPKENQIRLEELSTLNTIFLRGEAK